MIIGECLSKHLSSYQSFRITFQQFYLQQGLLQSAAMYRGGLKPTVSRLHL